MAKLKPILRKVLVVQAYHDMDKLLATIIQVENFQGETRETPYEPLQEEREEELALGETSTNKRLMLEEKW